MKWLTSCLLLWQLPGCSFGTHAKSTFYYFACKFDPEQVQPLITSGYQFYKYLQQDPKLWEEYSKYMKSEDKDDNRNYLNRKYSHGVDELHTTMFFAHSAEALEKYEEQPQVKKYLNRPFELRIYGVFITPSTMGFRMKLTTEALSLWDADDKTKPLHDPVCSDMFGNQTMKNPSAVFAPSNFTRGSRAHATVLTSTHTHPVQTGLDLVDIQYCEQHCREDPYYRDVELPDAWNAKMRYYGFGRFVFYLDRPHVVSSVFRKVEV